MHEITGLRAQMDTCNARSASATTDCSVQRRPLGAVQMPISAVHSAASSGAGCARSSAPLTGIIYTFSPRSHYASFAALFSTGGISIFRALSLNLHCIEATAFYLHFSLVDRYRIIHISSKRQSYYQQLCTNSARQLPLLTIF